ncbi:MAG TPA: 4Fe-4S dicluster domain-containing protein [Thermodesulfobacteriota bacterium]|nr:4Fe-4S dicluster domain-containing protein [Thermodesulfobacteriota bacterium]
MKVIAVHLDRCTGCKTCELYCAVDRGSTGKTLPAAVQESPSPQARVRVEGNNNQPIAMQCRHCLKAPCIDACLTGALTRDAKANTVVVQDDRCIACWTCTMFCPYGVIYPWPEREFALKCDRCTYMETPVCVEVCPCKALELVEVDDYEKALKERRAAAAEKIPVGDKKALLVLDLE